MNGKRFALVALVASAVLMAASAFGQAAAPAAVGLPAQVESVLVWALMYLVGALLQRSPAWNEIIPWARYVVGLLAHVLGAPPAHAALADSTLALPGAPLGAAGLDLMVVTLFDNLMHKGVRLVGKVFKIKLPSWF